jgi:hypothetical protein
VLHSKSPRFVTPAEVWWFSSTPSASEGPILTK